MPPRPKATARRRDARPPAPAPVTGQLRSEALREQVIARIARLKPGDRLPSERALARESGLSLLTVNKVLATIGAEGFVDRRPGVGTFVAARAVRAAGASDAARLRILRFVVRHPAEVLDPGRRGYCASFYRGLHDAAVADGVEVLPTAFHLDDAAVESLPAEAFASASVEGVVFVEQGAPDYRPLWRFLEENRRIVAFDFAAPERGLNSVVFDNRGGIERAVEHCVRHGHRRIGYAAPGGAVGQPGDERRAGLLDALQRHGLDRDAAPMMEGWDDALAAAVRRVLALPPARRPTAIVGFSDEFLLPVLRVADELGLRVPRDLSLVGFGDQPVAETAVPRLDSIAFDETRMGRTAYVLWRSGARGVVKREPGRLVVRGSVGPPAR